MSQFVATYNVTNSVRDLGGIADVYTITTLGWTLRQIESAVRRGELRWVRDGRIELVPSEPARSVMVRYYGIDTGHGNSLRSAIVGEVAARRIAQQLANDRGDTVYLYEIARDGLPLEAEAIRPASPRR